MVPSLSSRWPFPSLALGVQRHLCAKEGLSHGPCCDLAPVHWTLAEQSLPSFVGINSPNSGCSVSAEQGPWDWREVGPAGGQQGIGSGLSSASRVTLGLGDMHSCPRIHTRFPGPAGPSLLLG